MRRYTRRSYRDIVESDLEIMPLMNLFVAMIPMLLISAVFLNVTVIDMKSPSEAEAADTPKKERLGLTVAIHERSFVIEGRALKKQVIDRTHDDADMQLADALATIVDAHPENRDVIIVSQPETLYSDIVAVMDITRDAGLPGVALLGAN